MKMLKYSLKLSDGCFTILSTDKNDNLSILDGYLDDPDGGLRVWQPKIGLSAKLTVPVLPQNAITFSPFLMDRPLGKEKSEGGLEINPERPIFSGDKEVFVRTLRGDERYGEERLVSVALYPDELRLYYTSSALGLMGYQNAVITIDFTKLNGLGRFRLELSSAKTDYRITYRPGDIIKGPVVVEEAKDGSYCREYVFQGHFDLAVTEVS